MSYCSILRGTEHRVPYLCVQFDTLHAIISISQFLCLLSRAVIQSLHRSKSSLLSNLWVLLQQFFNQETHFVNIYISMISIYIPPTATFSNSVLHTHSAYKHTHKQYIHIYYILYIQCVIAKPRKMRRPRPPMGLSSHKKNNRI